MRVQEQWHCVMQAPSDTDTVIVRSTLDTATSGQYVTVVGDDTNVLVYHCKPSVADIHMKQVPQGPFVGTTISIRLLQKSVGCYIVPRLLAIHANISTNNSNCNSVMLSSEPHYFVNQSYFLI